MILTTVLREILTPAFQILPSALHSQKAEVLLLAIGLQESRFLYRKQIGGPARGFWQFERGGGVRGVVEHPSTDQWVETVCSACGVTPPTVAMIYDTLATHDVLAACFARLLLWTHPAAMPELTDADGAWRYYVSTWRPGKPHRHTWDAFHARAVAAIHGTDLAP